MPLVVYGHPPNATMEWRFPVCSLLCLGLYRRWQMGKRARRAGCKRGKTAV
jgi:hypothetical protein